MTVNYLARFHLKIQMIEDLGIRIVTLCCKYFTLYGKWLVNSKYNIMYLSRKFLLILMAYSSSICKLI